MFKKITFVMATYSISGILGCSAGFAEVIDAQVNIPPTGKLQGYRNQKTIQEGMDDDLPKNYPIVLLEIKELPSSASLNIDKDGKATIHLDTESRSLKELDKSNAIKMFGELHYVRENDPCHTFHVLTFHPTQGPNIFHIDVEFNAAQLLTKYRVRGFGILKPEWQQIQ